MYDLIIINVSVFVIKMYHPCSLYKAMFHRVFVQKHKRKFVSYHKVTTRRTKGPVNEKHCFSKH